jgi:hypothetical protein
MPSRSIDWLKVEMNNWSQYATQVDSVKVKLHNCNNPTIEFIPSAIEVMIILGYGFSSFIIAMMQLRRSNKLWT